MIPLKTSNKRLSMLALMLPLLGAFNSFQEKTPETVYVMTAMSKPFELEAFKCDRKKQTEEECDSVQQALYALISKTEGCTTGRERECNQIVAFGMPAPDPCPTPSHCIPFLKVSRVCFYSEADKRPVEIYVNNKLIGKATEVSYDRKRKLRTVYFDGEKNHNDIDGSGNNLLRLKIPVTYVKSGKKLKTTLDATSQF